MFNNDIMVDIFKIEILPDYIVYKYVVNNAFSLIYIELNKKKYLMV